MTTYIRFNNNSGILDDSKPYQRFGIYLTDAEIININSSAVQKKISNKWKNHVIELLKNIYEYANVLFSDQVNKELSFINNEVKFFNLTKIIKLKIVGSTKNTPTTMLIVTTDNTFGQFKKQLKKIYSINNETQFEHNGSSIDDDKLFDHVIYKENINEIIFIKPNEPNESVEFDNFSLM